jgi:hypothetical protein
VSTPGFLVSGPGEILFYNEAAGALLARPFQEQGPMSAEEWLNTFGPFDENGKPIPLEEQSLTKALRANRPAHAVQMIRSLAGTEHQIAVSALPIVGADGFQGAMVFFWPVDDGASS